MVGPAAEAGGGGVPGAGVSVGGAEGGAIGSGAAPVETEGVGAPAGDAPGAIGAAAEGGAAAMADDAAAAEAVAEARSRGYHLLARLLAHGPTAGLRAEAATVPALRSVLPPEADPDAVAADHHALFGLDILPYEGVFRDPEGLLGGPATSAVAAACAAAGWAPPDRGESPDHAAVELAFLAWLAGGEADALRARDGAGRARRAAQRERFAAQHALRWLPALAAALEAAAAGGAPGAAGAAFHATVLGLAVAMTADAAGSGKAGHGGDDAPARAAGPAPDDPAASEAGELLADPRTGLREIARFLTSPARAGAYLGRGAVMRAAGVADVPHGFGDRRTMLGDALSAAAHRGRVGALARALDAEVALQARAIATWRRQARTAGWAELERALEGWAARGKGCREVLGVVARSSETDAGAFGSG